MTLCKRVQQLERYVSSRLEEQEKIEHMTDEELCDTLRRNPLSKEDIKMGRNYTPTPKERQLLESGAFELLGEKAILWHIVTTLGKTIPPTQGEAASEATDRIETDTP